MFLFFVLNTSFSILASSVDCRKNDKKNRDENIAESSHDFAQKWVMIKTIIYSIVISYYTYYS